MDLACFGHLRALRVDHLAYFFAGDIKFAHVLHTQTFSRSSHMCYHIRAATRNR